MAKRRMLITGATGMLGSWVLRHWQENHPDVELWATSDRPCPPGFSRERYNSLDLRDHQAVLQFVDACRPAEVLHLAGLVGGGSLQDHLSINVVGTDNLYEAFAKVSSPDELRVVQVGSAAIYGVVDSSALPIKESQPLRPVGPYALSKACQDQLAEAYCLSHHIQIIRARVFNMLGPGQPESLVPMTFIKQLQQCRLGKADRLHVGNTETRRDFVDVRDVVIALDMLLSRGQAGQAYNVASGKDASIGWIVDELLAISGLSVPVEVVSDRVRAVDVPCVMADVSKIFSQVGWNCRIDLHDSLEAMLSSQAATISSERTR